MTRISSVRSCPCSEKKAVAVPVKRIDGRAMPQHVSSARWYGRGASTSDDGRVSKRKNREEKR